MGGDFSTLDHGLMERFSGAMVALLLLISSYFVARLMSRYVAAAICRRVDETLGKFLGRVTFYAILIGSGLGVLSHMDIDIAGPMAVLTAAGFAIGLAFQGTLSNFASGVLLLVFRPFKVGDTVSAGGIIGRVNEIDLFTTTFDTPDNRRMIVPNSAIAGGTIENMTHHAHRRVDVVVGVAYGASLDLTREALTTAANGLSELVVTGDNRGYQIILTTLGTSSVDWTIRFWTATDKVLEAREKLTQEIKRQLDRVGIEIPFPQMHVHFSSRGEGAQTAQTLEDEAFSRVRPRMRRQNGEAA